MIGRIGLMGLIGLCGALAAGGEADKAAEAAKAGELAGSLHSQADMAEKRHLRGYEQNMEAARAIDAANGTTTEVAKMQKAIDNKKAEIVRLREQARLHELRRDWLLGKVTADSAASKVAEAQKALELAEKRLAACDGINAGDATEAARAEARKRTQPEVDAAKKALTAAQVDAATIRRWADAEPK